jgi:phosphohistidine phosphatase SixA
MQKYYYLLILIFFSACTHKLYIVRHAEKNTDQGKNPHLSVQGQERAVLLNQILGVKNITQIYSTNTLRTTETATPLSQSTKTIIQLYQPDSIQYILKNIFISKRNTLIVGHSNTIVPMLDSLGIKHTLGKISDNDYSNLFTITYKKYNKKSKRPYKIKNAVFTKYGNTN